MEQIKVLTYKADYNTATIKTIWANKIPNTNIFYTTKKETDGYNANQQVFNYYFSFNDDLLCYEIETNTTRAIEQVENWYNTNKHKCTKEFLINYIKECIQNKKYTNNLHILFCETCGLVELAEQCKQNKMQILAEREESRKQEEKIKEEQETARKLAEETKRLQDIDNAEQKIKEQKFITPQEFELLCNKYNISLAPKFTGWLRSYCGDIQINPITQEEINKLPPNVFFTNKYNTKYYYQKKHNSTMIFIYADKLAEAVGI